jgi:hypothetical protein
VNQTEDTLFGDLSREDRMLLYLSFVREADREQIAASLGCELQDVPKRLQAVLAYLRGVVALVP